MHLQSLDGVELTRQLRLCEQRVNLPVANAVQILGVFAAFTFGHQVVRIALRRRDEPFAQRAKQRIDGRAQAAGL